MKTLYKVYYRGRPLQVHGRYNNGKIDYDIYDAEYKKYGASYSSLSRAEKHAKEWNKIYRNRGK